MRSPTHPAIPQLLPNYTFVGPIYQGARTTVYRAIETATQQSVVIKVLTQEYPSFAELVQFRNQYIVAKNLPISGVVRPLGLEFWGNGYALVMEDIESIDLGQYVQQHPLNLAEILNIAIQLADILHDLYQYRVIHKDIKPANILIHPESKQVKLIDFSIASLLPKETQTIQSPGSLEGTLAYLAPEQTGRMNRGIDYRTDFYALGVTLYQLLTGQLPFTSDAPLELVHCHMAKAPVSPYEIGSQKSEVRSRKSEVLLTPSHLHPIPKPLSDIVLKLMAKNAENRYQSTVGLKYDLEQCLLQWKEQGEITDVVLGQRDSCDRFLIPEKLYGRETEIQTLLNAFDRVAQGISAVMLVAGLSGIGKTAVINEVHKPIVQRRGYFIKGKFDQFNRNIPFSAFVQAFQDLVRQLLSESDVELGQWKIKILEAINDNGQVLIDVIPELEQVIGPQPQSTKLSGTAAQNRFNLLLQKFIAVFTTPDHPLVMFLDDLQWADLASLNLIKVLMADTQSSGHLMLLGAYRDNEVFPAHSLMVCLRELEKQQITVSTITLAPLSIDHVNRLVAETLSCNVEIATPLTNLVYKKTKGNPFFTTQFLKGLHEDELITFNWDLGYWECDLVQVRDAAITDDVVAFMAGRLYKLPEATQKILKLAACVGNQFDLETLAIVCETTLEDVATDLWRALQEGLVLPLSDAYKFFQDGKQNDEKATGVSVGYRFLHDRVQQAAYSLIPEQQKQTTHYQIGKLLLQYIASDKWEEKIFDIVNQLNQAVSLAVTQSERKQLVELNLIAGKKAIAATAYAAATNYLEISKTCLDANSWESHYKLTLSVYEATIKAEYLNINFARAQTISNFVSEKTTSVLDRVKLYELQIQMYMAQAEMTKALDVGISALELLDIDLNHAPTNSTIQLPELSAIASLPMMQDAHQIIVMRILGAIFAPSYTTQPELLLPIVLTMIELSLKHGHTSMTAFAYVIYGLLLCGSEKDLERGYYCGLLALSVLNRFSARELECTVHNLFNVFIRPWKEPLANSLESLEKARDVGFETGNIEYASYATAHRCTYLFLSGENLLEVREQQTIAMEILQRVKQAHSLGHTGIWQQLVSHLTQGAAESSPPSVNYFDDEKILPALCEGNDKTLPFTAYLTKCILSYFLEDYSTAIQSAVNAEAYSDVAIGITAVTYNFYHSLSLLARYTDESISRNDLISISDSNYTSLLERVDVNQQLMKEWSVLAPENCEHKYFLVKAEKYRILGQKVDAIELYDRAIVGARENKYIQEEALANELAAKFYLAWGKEKIAAVYMQEAYYGYSRWGAKVKVTDLEARYPRLLHSILHSSAPAGDVLTTLTTLLSTTSVHTSAYNSVSSANLNQAFDFISILKASRTISGSIQLNDLLRQLTQIILQNSGGDSCTLVLPNMQSEWQVCAFANDKETHLYTKTLINNSDVPVKLIQYVKNTQEMIVINDLKTDLPVIDDYLTQHIPKSILCLPLINQGHLSGIVYLQNQLTSGVFTNDHILVLNFLGTQAAISLENAQLYQQAQHYAKQLEQSQLQLVQNEKMATLGNLVAGVAHEVNNPIGFLNGSIQNVKDYLQDLFEHLECYQKYHPPTGPVQENAEDIDLEFVLADLPKLLDSMQGATNRIKGISTSLRTFSRADTENKVSANLHEGLDSTLLILKYRLKANEQRPAIDVMKNYGELPEITCFPGQLNQVFMNILANAIDMFDEMAQSMPLKDLKNHPQQITIATAHLADQDAIEVRISDNGWGMPDEVKSRIFDHSFTTKAVGKGTGLGLAIARQIIVDTHGGSLDVQSEVGQGSEFCIRLPL